MELTQDQMKALAQAVAAIGNAAPAPTVTSPAPGTVATPKPGFLTSEFWVTAGVALSAILVPALQSSANQWLQLTGLCVAALVSSHFIQSRTAVKAATAQAGA